MLIVFFVGTGLGNLIQDRGSEETELVIDFYDHDGGDGGVGAGDDGGDEGGGMMYHKNSIIHYSFM